VARALAAPARPPFLDEGTEPMTHQMDRLLFGDNQFFGVNHMSEDKAREQAMRFRDLDAIMEVLDAAYDEGVRTFMCTTHARIAEVVERVKADPERYPDYQFYPCMPYAHKYANAVTELGMMGAVRSFLPETSLFSAAMKGGKALATKDISEMMTMLIDSEMNMFRGVSTPVIFLQNVVVDLLLGLGFDDAFSTFAEHVRERYQAEPGFITMNLPRLLDTLDKVGIENPIVCANMNKIGFRMSGGFEAYQAALENREFRAIAMSVLASGAIPPREAFAWVAEFPNIQSVVFGASSQRNIHNTVEVAAAVWPEHDGALLTATGGDES
jgi:hypothetical protein